MKRKKDLKDNLTKHKLTKHTFLPTPKPVGLFSASPNPEGLAYL